MGLGVNTKQKRTPNSTRNMIDNKVKQKKNQCSRKASIGTLVEAMTQCIVICIMSESEIENDIMAKITMEYCQKQENNSIKYYTYNKSVGRSFQLSLSVQSRSLLLSFQYLHLEYQSLLRNTSFLPM